VRGLLVAVGYAAVYGGLVEQVPVLFPGAIGARISGEGLVAMVCVETAEPVELGEKTEMIH
jgi:hypothetical protein